MIIELICSVALGTASMWTLARATYTRVDESKKEPISVILTKLSDTGEMLVELLKSDEGWTFSSRHAEHKSGINLDFERSGPYAYAWAKIINEDGKKEALVLTCEDQTGIYNEFKTATTRREAARNAELTRLLAKRVLGREVSPILGGTRVSSPGDDDKNNAQRSVDDSLSAGVLAYDPATRTIIATVRGENVRLDATPELMARYNLPHLTPLIVPKGYQLYG